jgi:D-alanyl-D-alanine carboxypeptidase/D-alanyl-D-alanine-endopeptidase (penicillin-binding protein 4)
MMSPVVHIEPIVPGIVIENKAIMAQIDPFQKSLKVKKKLVKGKDVIAVEGAMSLKAAPLKFSIPVRHPAQFAATEFSLILKKTGIKHEGKIVFEHAGASAQVLATHFSDPLFDLTRKMLKSNNDLYANCLLKKIGRVRFGKPGTWPNGSQASREFLKKIIDRELNGTILVDGSGESGYNAMTPEIMTLFLKQLHQKFVYAPEFMACMPLSGVDGCFKKRFKEKSFYSKLRGFNFSDEKDSCLCGYLMTNQQENLAFCLMIKQSEPYQQASFSEIEDRICEALFKYAKGE